MAVKKDTGHIYIILLAIIVSPFIFLYTFLGYVGFWVVIFLIGAAFIYWSISAKKKDFANFQKLALDTITIRMHPDEMKDINLYLSRRNHQEAIIIRSLQIIKESLDIALSSKKRDVASSRMELALKLFAEVKNSEAGLLDAGTTETISRIISDTEKLFHTKLYLNIAQGYIEKANKLKTEKARSKYIQMAQDIIIEGLNNPNSNKEDLKAFAIQNLSTYEIF